MNKWVVRVIVCILVALSVVGVIWSFQVIGVPVSLSALFGIVFGLVANFVIAEMTEKNFGMRAIWYTVWMYAAPLIGVALYFLLQRILPGLGL